MVLISEPFESERYRPISANPAFARCRKRLNCLYLPAISCYVGRAIPSFHREGEPSMRAGRSIMAAIVLALCIAICSQAGPTTKPSGDQKTKPIRLFKPWSEIKSLTDEQ